MIKLDLAAEKVVLELSSRPALKEIRLLLQENKIEEAQETAARKILSLLVDYRDRELQKYRNTPDSLKSAPNSERMLINAERMEAVCSLFMRKNKDSGTEEFRPCEEWDLDAADRVLQKIINS